MASEICNELKLFEFSYTGDLVNIIEKDEQKYSNGSTCLLLFAKIPLYQTWVLNNL
ncbi:MAG: hypothetical protein L6V78_04900 [Clostridium sp.]|nr:MAG: hypothetical protein L6V78_04900 [Clostridium sp.]